MSLNVDTVMDEFNMKPKSMKHCKSSKSSNGVVQGKTSKVVYGKAYKENDSASGHTFSNALQRDSLSNSGVDMRWQNSIYVTTLASVVACWIMIM